jgi:hypothetical protein
MTEYSSEATQYGRKYLTKPQKEFGAARLAKLAAETGLTEDVLLIALDKIDKLDMFFVWDRADLYITFRRWGIDC